MPVSQSKGVILLAAAEKKIPVLEFTPLQIKMTVSGYGRAGKKQVIEMIKKILNLDEFDLKIKNRKKDDSFDALGVAICAAYKNY
jgi:crossover junction endodeoxyribonuclease RuvC